MPSAPSPWIAAALVLLDLGLGWAAPEQALPRVVARTLAWSLVAWALASRLHPEEPVEARVVAAGLYLWAGLGLLLRGLALLGVLGDGGAALATAVGAPVMLRALGTSPPWPPRGAEGRAEEQRTLGLARLLVLVGLVAWQGSLWGTAPVGWDGFAYHLDWPAAWRASGSLATPVAASGDPAVPFYPKAAALWTLWWVLPGAGLDPLAQHLELPFLVGVLLAAGLVIERLGVPRLAARLGALLLATSPLLMTMTPGLGNDLALAFAALMTLHAALRHDEERGVASALRLGVAAGMTAGTKYLGVVYLPVLLLPLVLAGRWPVHLGVALAAALVGAGPEYLRNLVATGNPLFPARLQLAGVTLLPGLQDLGWIFSRRLASEDFAFTAQAAGKLLGPLWWVLVPGALAAPWLPGRPRERGLRALPLALFAAFYLGVPHRHLRFLLPVVPLVAGAGLAAWFRVPAALGRALLPLGALLALGAAFQAGPGLALAQRARMARWGSYPRYGEIARAWGWVEHYVDEDESLLVALDVATYPYRGAAGRRRVLRPSLAGPPLEVGALEAPGLGARYRAKVPLDPDRAAFRAALRAPGADWIVLNAIEDGQLEKLAWTKELPGYRLVKRSESAQLWRRVAPAPGDEG